MPGAKNMTYVCCGLNTPAHVLYKPEKHRLLNLSYVKNHASYSTLWQIH